MRPRALEIDRRTGEDPSWFDWDLVRAGAEHGMLGFLIPKPAGGSGGLATQAAVVMEELCAACPGIALIFGAHALGISPLLLGGPSQWDGVLAELVASERTGEPQLMACAITEPEAGTDVEDPDLLRARAHHEPRSPCAGRLSPERHQAVHLQRQRRALDHDPDADRSQAPGGDLDLLPAGHPQRGVRGRTRRAQDGPARLSRRRTDIRRGVRPRRADRRQGGRRRRRHDDRARLLAPAGRGDRDRHRTGSLRARAGLAGGGPRRQGSARAPARAARAGGHGGGDPPRAPGLHGRRHRARPRGARRRHVPPRRSRPRACAGEHPQAGARPRLAGLRPRPRRDRRTPSPHHERARRDALARALLDGEGPRRRRGDAGHRRGAGARRPARRSGQGGAREALARREADPDL